MNAIAEGISVEREIVIAASRETVWQFLVDPAKAVRWMGLAARFDARPGGRYEVEVIPGSTAGGVFVEVDPPSRLVYTWGWKPGSPSPLPPGSTTVEFELVAEGEGTRLRFAHRRLPDAAAAAGHTRGWEHYLGRLATVAAGGDPGVDSWIEHPPV